MWISLGNHYSVYPCEFSGFFLNVLLISSYLHFGRCSCFLFFGFIFCFLLCFSFLYEISKPQRNKDFKKREEVGGIKRKVIAEVISYLEVVYFAQHYLMDSTHMSWLSGCYCYCCNVRRRGVQTWALPHAERASSLPSILDSIVQGS